MSPHRRAGSDPDLPDDDPWWAWLIPLVVLVAFVTYLLLSDRDQCPTKAEPTWCAYEHRSP